MEAVFATNQGMDVIRKAYSEETRGRLAKELEFAEGLFSPADLEKHGESLTDVKYIFSTWGMPALTVEDIRRYFPRLQAVFYAAGSVQYFAKPFLRSGIRVFSAWAANAVPVAEYTVSQIVLACKGYHQAVVKYKKASPREAAACCGRFPGCYGVKVGIIAAGKIGSLVIRMLKAYEVEALVFDPFLSDMRARELGVTKCGLDVLFSECQVISNHLANNEQTKGILNYPLFSRMRPNATFINTGRGAQVVEADLIRALKEQPGRTAVLDVTDPEPPLPGHEFYNMDNVFISPHIAGSLGNEIARMGDLMYREYRAVREGRPVTSEITLAMLETMA